jgi:hypothetical protein
MTHILIPRTPTLALLRPFFECPTSELDQAWAAMVRIAEVQHARVGRQCLQQIEEGPQSVDIAINHGTEDLAMHSLSTAPAAVARRSERQWICSTRTVADLVNNLLTMDQALPVYGAQYIERDGRRCAIAVPPTVSRERVKDGRWIGQGEELNAAVIWTRAEQPAAVAGLADELAELAMLNKLIELGAKASYAHAKSNSDDGPAGTAAYVQWQELRAEMGELIRAHVAPALEAPAAPSEADIASAREHVADVHNATQMRSALSQLRPEVVVELVARGLVPSIYAPMAAAPQAPAAPVAAAIPDAAYCALQYVEHALAAIANREELADGAFQPMDSIGKASKRAKAALARLQSVAHHFSAGAAPAAPAVDALSQAAQDVLAERRRQVEAEGWTPEHDDQHDEGEMCFAAAGYAAVASDNLQAISRDIDRDLTLDDNVYPPTNYPWPRSWEFKPCTPRRALVKSGALILAEIERIDRCSPDAAQAAAKGAA